MEFKMKRKLEITLLIVIITFLSTTLNLGMGAMHKHEDKIKIGAVLPLTGKLSFLGDRVKKGIMLAEDILKKQGKAHLKIIFADSKSKPKEAVSASNKLIDINKVDVLIVLATPMVNAVYPITERAGIPLIAQTIHPQITKKGTHIIQYFGSGSHEWKILADFLSNESYNNVVVFSINNEYGIDCYTILKKHLRVKDVTNIIHEFGETNLTNIIAKHRKQIEKANGIVLIGYASDYYNIIKKLNEVGIRGKTYFSTEAFLDKKLLDSGLIENSFAFVPKMQIEDYQTEEYRKINQQFKEKYNDNLNFEAFYGLMNLLLLGELGVKDIHIKLNDYVFNTIVGEVQFKNREANTSVGIGVVKEGLITAIK